MSPSNEYSGLISFRIDCIDLFVVQGTLKSLIQHDSSPNGKKMCPNIHIKKKNEPLIKSFYKLFIEIDQL